MDVIYPNKTKEVTPNLILDTVAEHFGVSVNDISSKRRDKEFAIPRQIIMYLCRNMTTETYQNIAALLGKKDHTTVISGVKKIEKLIETDSELKNKIETIKKKISPS